MKTLKTMLIACAITFLAIVPGSAQQPPTYGAPMTLEQAKKAMAAAEAEAVKNNLVMVIAIVDSTGHLQMLHRWTMRAMARSGSPQARPRRRSSSASLPRTCNDRLNAGTATHLLTISGATLIEGGLPIVVGGKIVGAIGVSGGSPMQDAQVAKAGVDAVQ